MKNKKILPTYIILLFILISISQGLKTPTPELACTIKKEKTFEEQLQKITYYKKENLKRYQDYQEQNPTLSKKQIVTDVNIGLDMPYYTNIKEAPLQNTPQILVNKYNVLSKNYVPENLETINSKYSNTGMKLVKEAKNSFEEMSAAASQENLNIIAMSTYRSYTYQETLYNKYVSIDGQEKADTYSARPGHSEHQTGLAVDVYNKILPYTSFEETKEFTWMQENAHKYGYILRYPKDKVKQTGYQYESWHYRYVGIEIATYLHNHNITYDEYFVRNLDN